MSQFIVYTFLIDILVNKSYSLKVVLVAESVERPSMVRSDRGSNPAASHFLFFIFFHFLLYFFIFFHFFIFLPFYGAFRVWSWPRDQATVHD
jgi:hypothetical protein